MDCGNGQGVLPREGCLLFAAAERSLQCEGWQCMVEQAAVEHLVWFRWLQRWLEEESPGEEELNSWPQTVVFSFAVAG